MDEKQKKHSGGIWAAIVLAILLVAYPLSAGPAALFFELTGRPTWERELLGVFYWPLDHLPEPCVDALSWWAEAWEHMAR